MEVVWLYRQKSFVLQYQNHRIVWEFFLFRWSLIVLWYCNTNQSDINTGFRIAYGGSASFVGLLYHYSYSNIPSVFDVLNLQYRITLETVVLDQYHGSPLNELLSS